MATSTTSLVIAFSLAISFLTSFDIALGAVTEEKTRLSNLDSSESHFPSLVHLAVQLGNAKDLRADQTSYESGREKFDQTFMGAVLLGIGRGIVSFEAGAMYLNLASDIGYQDVNLSTHHFATTNEYIGIPMWLKLNYIERPLASFFFKLGAIPVFLQNQKQIIPVNRNVSDRDKQLLLERNVPTSVSIAQSDTLAIAGLGGTAPISDSVAFLVDLSYVYGLSGIDQVGSRNQSALLNAGLLFTF